MNAKMGTRRGAVIYDPDYGHVCRCTERVARDAEGYPHMASFEATVVCDRGVEPSEGGSWWYYCTRCGAGAWSGC